MILERRQKAVRVDLGQGEPAWFPLHAVELDEQNYTLTAEASLIDEKVEGGGTVTRSAFEQELVKLATPAWVSDVAVGIDVIVWRLDGRKEGIRKRVFFRKSDLQDGAVPRWLLQAKERKVIDEVATPKRSSREYFIVRGLRGRGF